MIQVIVHITMGSGNSLAASKLRDMYPAVTIKSIDLRTVPNIRNYISGINASNEELIAVCIDNFEHSRAIKAIMPNITVI